MHFLPVSDVTLVGAATLGGWGIGRLARFVRLPSIIGYMFLGILLGPSLFDSIDLIRLERFQFITQLALGFVAFSIGSELSFDTFRRLGGGIVSIIFVESFLAFTCVFAAVWFFTNNLPLALIFGAVAPASAPAGTVAVIQELRAEGSLTKALYAMVGFDER